MIRRKDLFAQSQFGANVQGVGINRVLAFRQGGVLSFLLPAFGRVKEYARTDRLSKSDASQIMSLPVNCVAGCCEEGGGTKSTTIVLGRHWLNTVTELIIIVRFSVNFLS